MKDTTRHHDSDDLQARGQGSDPSLASVQRAGHRLGDLPDLRDTVAVVTGAGSGLGNEIARLMLAAGADTVLHYRSSRSGAEELARQYGEDRCRLIEGDFEDPTCVKTLCDAALEWQGHIDILVNNAAFVKPVESSDEIDEDLLEKSLKVNFIAPFMLTKLAVQAMRNRRSGRIVSISSIGVKYAGSPQTIQYSVSKAALESGTLALAKEAASYNVLINVLRAGITRTPVHDRLGRDMEARVGLIPLKRVAEPSEIARVVLFLVSPHNTYLTGAIIPVAGGE